MSSALIIGAGISGMMSARALILAGWRVELLDQGSAAGESSWAGGGILSPMNPWRYPDAVTALAQEGHAVYQTIAEELTEHGLDPEWEPGGLLSLSPFDIQTAIDWARRWQLEPERLDNSAIKALEPTLTDQHEEAIFLPSIGRIRPPRLGKAMRRWLERNGAGITENTRVLGFDHTDGRVNGLLTDGKRLCADVYIVATGAWTRQLMTQINTPIEIDPVRGQMLLFADAAGLLGRIVLDGDRYLIPRRDGHMLIGSTVEHVGFDKTTTSEARADLERAAIAMLPALAKRPIAHHWSGLRPGKRDHIPFIGRHPHYENLFLNAGHYRNGVILSPGSARLLADLILNREPWVDPGPYRLPA